MKRFWFPTVVVFFGVLAFLAASFGPAEAARPAKKAAPAPAQLVHSGKASCKECHGTAKPPLDSTVENPRCLECHGPMEQLAKKTEPKDFPDRNPHKSHLGDIACTVCHHEHSASKVYCLECHKKFQMNMPGGK